MSKPAERRPMTDDEHVALNHLCKVTFPVASWDKMFFNSICPLDTITEKEAPQLWRLFKRYRRQMDFPDKERLLELAEILAAPDFRKQRAAERARQRIEEIKKGNNNYAM